MGYQKEGNDFSTLYPFNMSEHYHKDCGLYNYNDQYEV